MPRNTPPPPPPPPPKPAKPATNPMHLDDARGGIRLLVDGTRHVTSMVEALHGQILRLAPPLRRRGRPSADQAEPAGPATLPVTRGITGLVYRSIHGTTRLVGDGLDGLLAPFGQALGNPAHPSPRRDALVAALNGVLGDHLLRSGNPLALTMQLRQGGLPLDVAAWGAAAPRRLLLLVHGLCMSDAGWRRNGHDHGQLLGTALQAAPVYALYNSGLHISANGRALSAALQQLVQAWQGPLPRIDILGHSMGGLVARSAPAQAGALGHSWPQQLQALVFLGSPHHGAPLERAGNWLHRVLDLSPYAAPFTRLSGLRSQGITDLRHGNLLDTDWQPHARFDSADHRSPVPLPAGVQAFALAGTAGGPGVRGSQVSDGLVTVDSALGRHRKAALTLQLPTDHTAVLHGVHHLDLLCDPAVYRKVLGWLQG